MKYSNSRQAFMQIVSQDGPKALFYGAGANVVRSIAGNSVGESAAMTILFTHCILGALVLTGYDRMQAKIFGEAVSSSE